MREGGHGGHRGHRGHGRRHGYEYADQGGIQDFSEQRFHSAQTFRRGRVIAFLEKLNVKRSTLLRQLNQPEYESIKPVISGELKAVDAIIQEFIHTFELSEASTDVKDQTRDGEDSENDRS